MLYAPISPLSYSFVADLALDCLLACVQQGPSVPYLVHNLLVLLICHFVKINLIFITNRYYYPRSRIYGMCF